MNKPVIKSTPRKKTLQVFLCHSHADRPAVQALYARLKRDHIKPWLDSENLLPGQDWEYEIRNAIVKCEVVIVCLSQQFDKPRGFRHEELRVAIKKAHVLPKGDLFIIPLRLEKCGLPASLRHLHRVDLFEADGYKKLFHSLQMCTKTE